MNLDRKAVLAINQMFEPAFLYFSQNFGFAESKSKCLGATVSTFTSFTFKEKGKEKPAFPNTVIFQKVISDHRYYKMVGKQYGDKEGFFKVLDQVWQNW
jgi:hypothetical protein